GRRAGRREEVWPSTCGHKCRYIRPGHRVCDPKLVTKRWLLSIVTNLAQATNQPSVSRLIDAFADLLIRKSNQTACQSRSSHPNTPAFGTSPKEMEPFSKRIQTN